MAKQIQDAYIVAATRTAVGKAPRGMFRNTRPDDLLAHVLRAAIDQCPGMDAATVDDVIVVHDRDRRFRRRAGHPRTDEHRALQECLKSEQLVIRSSGGNRG